MNGFLTGKETCDELGVNMH